MEIKKAKPFSKLLKEVNKMLKDSRNATSSPKFLNLLTLNQSSDQYKVLLQEQLNKTAQRVAVEKRVSEIKTFIKNEKDAEKNARNKYLLEFDLFNTLHKEINNEFGTNYLND